MITLEDVEVLTGLPTRGLPVTGRTNRRSVARICEQLLISTFEVGIHAFEFRKKKYI
ncbi:hypothetical protein LINPERHAP2_LOCUS33527 [Linum perenne]